RRVGAHAGVADLHRAFALPPAERVIGGDVAALAVLQRDDDLLTLPEIAGPGGVGVLDDELLVAAHEVLVVVADQTPRQQVRLHEHLESVADAQHGHARCRGILHLGHDRRQCRDRTGAQVVAVAEPTGKHECVHALEVVRAVPQGDRLGAGDAHGALRIAVIQRTGEGDDPDADGHWPTSMPTTSSITELESTSSARRRASASTSSVTSPSTVSSKRLPIRTWLKPSTPRRAKAPETALPCGSS